MKKQPISMLLLCLLLIGCASTKSIRIGSDVWYNNRMAEIEEAFKNHEIDKSEHIRLKNETDEIRAKYQNSDLYKHSHVGYGTHGTSVGVGIGL